MQPSCCLVVTAILSNHCASSMMSLVWQQLSHLQTDKHDLLYAAYKLTSYHGNHVPQNKNKHLTLYITNVQQ